MLNTTVMVFPIARGGRFGVVSTVIEPRRIWRFGLVALTIQLTGCGLTLAPPGFVREHRHAVCRSWFDFNSHRRFSFTFETYDRLPPDSARVKLFRWSHGGSVEKLREVSYEEQIGFSENLSAPVIPNAPSTESPPANEPGVTEPGSGPLEFVPPPPAPPSEMEESGGPDPNDPAENRDPSSDSEGSEGTPLTPVVSLSFSEDLGPIEKEASMNSADCSVPNGEKMWPE